MFGSNKRVYVRRKIGERAATSCITSTVKHRGASVMVWDSVCILQSRRIALVEGAKMNQTGYHSIPRSHPFGARVLYSCKIMTQSILVKLCQTYIKTKKRSASLSNDVLVGAICGLKSHWSGVTEKSELNNTQERIMSGYFCREAGQNHFRSICCFWWKKITRICKAVIAVKRSHFVLTKNFRFLFLFFWFNLYLKTCI